MNRNLLFSNDDRRYSRCPFFRCPFFRQTWSIVLKRSSEWDSRTKRRVKFIISLIIFLFVVGISLAVIGILGLFYKKNPAGEVASQTFCRIPDFADAGDFHYNGYRFVSPAYCHSGAQLSQNHYCLVECNHTDTMRYTVRTEYKSVSLRPEHAWDLEGYVEYRRARWSCDSQRPSLTCLRPCDTPPEDLIANSNSLSSYTNKKHGDSCDISCQSSYVVFEREAREFQLFSHIHVSITLQEYHSHCSLMPQKHHSKSNAQRFHSKSKDITRKSTLKDITRKAKISLEKQRYHSKSNARTQT